MNHKSSLAAPSSLESLLSTRSILQPYPEDAPTITQLAAAALKLVSRSQDFSSLVEEMDWETGESSQELMHLIKEQIRLKPSFHGFSEREVLETLIIQTCQKYIMGVDSEGVERMARLVVLLRIEGLVDLLDVGRDLINTKIMVTDAKISWLLAWADLVPISIQFKQWTRQQASQFSLYMKDLISFCKTKTEVGEGLLMATVKTAYSGVIADQQRAQLVLKKWVMKILDEIYSGEEPELQWVKINRLENSLSSKWGLLGVTTMLKHRPNVKVGEAIKYQERWKVTAKSGLGSLCSGLIQTVDSCKELVELVGRVVGKKEVNWKAVLTMVTISIELMPQSDTAWHSLTSDMVRAGLEEGDQESFLSGLLLARQAALSSTPSFPSYNVWFHTSFGDEQTSLATPQRSHQFLMSQLTELVPCEPAYTMKVHITRPPAVPRQFKEELEEYKILARTQLTSLGENANDAVQITNNRPSDEIFEQVIKFVEEFIDSKKIPPALVEASMFRKPFFSSKLLPALLLVKLVDEKDTARGQLVELLNKKGKVPGHLFNSFISGEFKQTDLQVHEVKLPDEECSEESLASCLGVLSHLTEPEDLMNVVGQMSFILRTVLRQDVPHLGISCNKLSLANVLSAGQEKLAAGLHCKILHTFLTGGNWRKVLLPLLTSFLPMLRQTLFYILTTHTFQEELVELLNFMIESERSKMEVEEGKVMCVVDILGTKYQYITKYDQLEVMAKMLSGLMPSAGHSSCAAKIKHLENRKFFLAGEDLPHSYEQLSLQDVKDVFELEAVVTDKVDMMGQVQKLHLMQACAQQISISQLDLARCLLTTLLSVWDRSFSIPSSTIIMVQAVNKVVEGKVWLKLWREQMITNPSMSDKMATIFNLVPGFMLCTPEDVSALASCRSPSKFGVSLPLSRLVMSSFGQALGGLRYSLAYWTARGSISLPAGQMERGEMEPFWSWRMNRLDEASSARVGLIMLAEDYLRGEDILSFDAANPTIKKLVLISTTVGKEAMESVLSTHPNHWFPNSVISTLLSSSISLVLLKLSISESALLSTSPQFCVLTLLPLLSELLNSMEVQDWDLGMVTMGVITKLQEWQINIVKVQMEKLEVQLHPDLEALLQQYFH